MPNPPRRRAAAPQLFEGLPDAASCAEQLDTAARELGPAAADGFDGLRASELPVLCTELPPDAPLTLYAASVALNPLGG
eukprot:2331970-Prymnesium_polylepis.1